MKKILLFIFLIIPFLLAGQTNKNIERSINITALQAGSDHFKNGNPGNESNFGIFAGLARKAAASQPKPDLICFPEYAITGWGYPSEKIMNGTAEKIPGEGYWYKRYEDLARETATPILGWLVESSGGKLYNTSFMLDGHGNYLGKYRKVQANLGEQTWWGWSQGEEFSLIELDGVKYGISICADMWYPETVRCEELLGADVILHVSIADDMGHLIPARAFDSKLPIIVSVFQGGAYAVDDEGRLLGKLKAEKADFITFTVKPFRPQHGNKYGGVWDTKKGAWNVRNPAAYKILTDPSTRPDWTEIFMDNNGNPQTKEQLLKRFNGRYDAYMTDKPETHAGSFEKWERIELEFTGPYITSANPFEVEADVIFTSPAGREYKVPAFYDGDGRGNPAGNLWKVRFSADETGVWNYRIESDVPGLIGNKGFFRVDPADSNSPQFYKWGRLESVSSPGNNMRYLKFREGPYWLKAGCDDPENFLGNITTYNTNEKRKAAIDHLASKGINSFYIIINNIDGDGKDTWPWEGKDPAEAKINSNGRVKFNLTKLEEWREIFEYMQTKGLVVYLVLEDDNAWRDYDHERYYREIIARFGYLPALIFNLNEEYNENYSIDEALGLAALLKNIDPYDHPCGIHNFNKPDDDYIKAAQVDFTAIQTGVAGEKAGLSLQEYNDLASGWMQRCKDLSARTLMIGFDEGRPEHDRRVWWSAYLSGAVWEAHVLEPYDRPMNAWDTIWTQLGGTRKFMESLPFWSMYPDTSVIVQGNAYCLNHNNAVIAIYIPEGGPIKLNLPEGNTYNVYWWNPANGYDGKFQNEATVKGGLRKLVPPEEGDWGVRIVLKDSGNSFK